MLLEELAVVRAATKKLAFASLALARYARLPTPECRGMREEARIRLARALVADADVYLLDEPFNGLDATTKTATLRLTQRSLSGKTCVLVTHNTDELSLVDTVYEIQGGELHRAPTLGG
jgi:ABC-type transporter Mla maintaining outer membrane lipid asymmetry ATPase subunit MlaF